MADVGDEITARDLAKAAFDAGVSYSQTRLLAEDNEAKQPDFDRWWANAAFRAAEESVAKSWRKRVQQVIDAS